MAVDPVCGMSVDSERAAARREHQGKTHYFCAPGCAARFDEDPAGWASGRRAKEKMRAPAPQFLRPGKTLPLFSTPRAGGPPPADGHSAGGAAPGGPRSISSRTRPAGANVALAVEGMHCASCVSTIEAALASLPGVEEASVNLATARANVRGENLDTERMIEAVRASGYLARLAEETSPDDDARRSRRESRELLLKTLTAAEVRPRARVSSQRPSRMSVTMTPTAS